MKLSTLIFASFFLFACEPTLDAGDFSADSRIVDSQNEKDASSDSQSADAAMDSAIDSNLSDSQIADTSMDADANVDGGSDSGMLDPCPAPRVWVALRGSDSRVREFSLRNDSLCREYRMQGQVQLIRGVHRYSQDHFAVAQESSMIFVNRDFDTVARTIPTRSGRMLRIQSREINGSLHVLGYRSTASVIPIAADSGIVSPLISLSRSLDTHAMLDPYEPNSYLYSDDGDVIRARPNANDWLRTKIVDSGAFSDAPYVIADGDSLRFSFGGSKLRYLTMNKSAADAHAQGPLVCANMECSTYKYSAPDPLSPNHLISQCGNSSLVRIDTRSAQCDEIASFVIDDRGFEITGLDIDFFE